jgi:hypothetical protein
MTELADEPFLTRWSRRKATDRRGAPGGASEPAAEAAAAPGPPASEPPELPDPATLDGTSDYRPFLRAGVPPELRRDALRTLWRSNPIINSLDGLDDHYVTQDFTDHATVVAAVRTIYRVGKGMLDAVERIEAEAATEFGPPRPAQPARLEVAADTEVEPVAAEAAPAPHDDVAEPA